MGRPKNRAPGATSTPAMASSARIHGPKTRLPRWRLTRHGESQASRASVRRSTGSSARWVSSVTVLSCPGSGFECAIPGNHLFDSFLQLPLRTPAKDSPDVADVSDKITRFDGGILRRPVGHNYASASRGGDHRLGHPPEGHSRSAPHVEHFAVCGRISPSSQESIHHVVDVNVVSDLLAGPVHLECHVSQGAVNEPVDDPVAVLLETLKRTVRVGDSQNYGLNGTQPMEEQMVVFARQFVDSIRSE